MSGQRDEWVSLTILFWTDWARVRLFTRIDGFLLSRQMRGRSCETRPKTVMSAGSPVLLLRVSSD